jgi:hypothetical protein
VHTHVEAVSTVANALLNLATDGALGELAASAQNRRVREPVGDDAQRQHLLVRERITPSHSPRAA